MIHKSGPYRQCVSCRRVFPKGALLRFVQSGTGEAALDERQKVSGRGFYLCPEQHCFTSAWKNKKARALLKDESAGALLFQSVRSALLLSVEDLLHAGLGGSMDGSPGALKKGDILLVGEEPGGRQLYNHLEAAQEQGVFVFMVPRTVLCDEEAVAITKKSPKITPILRNLRFYARLSSKGRAL